MSQAREFAPDLFHGCDKPDCAVPRVESKPPERQIRSVRLESRHFHVTDAWSNRKPEDSDDKMPVQVSAAKCLATNRLSKGAAIEVVFHFKVSEKRHAVCEDSSGMNEMVTDAQGGNVKFFTNFLAGHAHARYTCPPMLQLAGQFLAI